MDDQVILLPSQLLALNTSQSNRHSARRGDRPPLRSSPLAGPSYSADKGGNLVQHSSALDQEIERRRRSQIHLHDSPSADALPTPPLSRKPSTDEPRHARPSFISLTPRPGSRDSLAPPSPVSPALRSRHSSPHIVANPRLSHSSPSLPRPTRPSTADSPPTPTPTADWMTAAPAPTFSRIAAQSSGVVLPVKASSRAGKRIRRKSMPSKSGSHRDPAFKSIRSIGGLFKHEDPAPPVPSTPTSPSYPRSRTSSLGETGPPTPTTTPVEIQPVAETDKERGRVRRLWAKVLGGVKRAKA